ncbi:MAG: penicillin-binding transpeptidase domain-containing protein, partial [Chlamydiota bacterium]
MALPSISFKTNRVLRIILLAFLVIVLRIWHLGVIQREEKLLESQKPQTRTILLRADRGAISDRFHIPLAVNRICYNAAIYYGQITQIPTVTWKSDSTGKRIRTFARKEYIRELSKLLADVLNLEAEEVEDQIHSKASLFPHVPYIVKAAISEEEHYRLRMLEHDFPGVHAEIAAERFYPLQKTACSLIGTMGAISQKEYTSIANEIVSLQEAVQLYEQGLDNTSVLGFDSIEAVYERLKELKEKAYAINDLIGKTGIEYQLEEDLRGFFGKKIFEVDQKGCFLRELPGGRPAVGGKQVVLSISTELQQFAESLLAQDEKGREGRSIGLDPADQTRKIQKQPWIKGGAIVAMDPNTGEVLALASHPRFDPNDFIPSANPQLKSRKQLQICRWLENERFIGAVFDGKELLSRERNAGSPRKFSEEMRPLTWDFYLESILPAEGGIKLFFNQFENLKNAIQLQEDFETLLYFSKAVPTALMDALFPNDTPVSPLSKSILSTLRESEESQLPQKRLEASLKTIASNRDKLFAIDLCRMIIYSPAFSDPLIAQIGSLKLGVYRALTQTFLRIESLLRKDFQKKFHDTEFQIWKEIHQKEFLAQMRKEEKIKKTYARPYLDYLHQKERDLFKAFWEEKRLSLVLPALMEPNDSIQSEIDKEPLLQSLCKQLKPELAEEFLRTFRPFSQLNRPLLASYKRLQGAQREQTEKDLAAAFYPQEGFGFTRSYAFQTSAPQGSIFKIVTAYEGLRQGQHFSLIDEPSGVSQEKGQIVAYNLNKIPYPRLYKGGRLPKSSLAQIGKIDLLGAIEQSSNPYFAILAGDYFKDPEDLARAAFLFGFGEKTGIELPGETRGNVPSDLKTNRTGLYSTAIGQHTLLSTPLQAASMLSSLANGGRLLKPKLIKESIGLSPDRQPLGAFSASSYFLKNELETIGISFPLFTGIQPCLPVEGSEKSEPEIKRMLPLSPQHRALLLEGMDRSLWSPKGRARPTVIRNLVGNPLLMRDYLSLQHQIVGKTGTAEILFNPYLNPSAGAQLYKHTWAGVISFNQNPLLPSKTTWDSPEL